MWSRSSITVQVQCLNYKSWYSFFYELLRTSIFRFADRVSDKFKLYYNGTHHSFCLYSPSHSAMVEISIILICIILFCDILLLLLLLLIASLLLLLLLLLYLYMFYQFFIYVYGACLQ